MNSPRNTSDASSLRTPLDPNRRSAWAQLGTSASGTRSAHEALVTAGLAGWDIRKVTMAGTELTPGGVTTLGNPEKVMLVYTDPSTHDTRYLSTVGTDYGVHQNEAGAAVIDALIAESGAAGVGFAGALDGGRKTFVTIELPTVMHVDGVDTLQLHLVVFNSHDGSSAFRVMIVPFRVWCANQLNMAINRHVSSVSIRHTSRSAINVTEIRNQLGLLYRYSDAFEAQAQQMIRAAMTRAEFDDLIREVWPIADDAPARAVANARRRTNELTRLWSSARTQANIRGTRWAGLQAITEYLDHHTPAKNDQVRATRVLGGDDMLKRKQTAYDLLSV